MPTLYDAFISYGHKDSKPFAILLHDELVKQGLSIWLDVDDMPPAIEFQKQIDEIIPKSHNIIFIISPLSVASEYCGKEIDLAIKCNKRIIPLLYRHTCRKEECKKKQHIGACSNKDCKGKPHPIIKKFAQIFFGKKQLENGEIDFSKQFNLLLSAINRQRDYVERHTSILVNALIWKRNHIQTQYLLIGEKRKEAEEWLQEKDELLPCEPTDLHCEYICASTINANNLLTQVFISYSIEDKEFAVELWHKLMRQHITVWMDDSQTQVAYQTDVKKHIENADNFIYLNSPNSLQSEICKQQKDYAISLHKRVIEYDSEQVDQLIKNLREDAYYYEQHKILLVKALKWEQWGRKATMLLRGYNLQCFVNWLQIAEVRQDYPPLKLQIEFVEVSQAQSQLMALDIFISYSQTDSEFARQLNDELQSRGKTTWFDQESIVAGVEDFEKEMYQGIADADNFLFILSPKAVNSEYCEAEVKYAASLNKRIIPVLYLSVDEEKSIVAALKIPQWIRFNNDKDFASNCGLLLNSLEIDRVYVREHTAWLREALKWVHHNNGSGYLLRDEALTDARIWLDKSQYKLFSPLIEELVVESEKVRSVEERERQQKQEELEDLRQARWRERLVSGISMAIIIGIGAAIYIKMEPPQRLILQPKIEAPEPYIKDPEVWFNHGVILGLSGRHEEAITSFDKALKIKSDYHEAWGNRGISLGDLGRYEEAIASYDKALEIKDNYHEAWYNRGNSLGGLGHHEEAVKSYDKALKIKPDKHEAWYNRGISLNKLDRHKEALKSYDKALEIKPDKHEAWFGSGYSLDELGRHEEAIASYDKALEIKPNYYIAWHNRGEILKVLKRYGEAIESYDKALEIKPDYHYSWSGRGISLHGLGRYEEAIANYDKALEIKPDDKLYLKNRQLAVDKLNEK